MPAGVPAPARHHERQATHVHRVHAVDVLVGVHLEQRGVEVDLRWRGVLDEEAVDERVVVEGADGGEHVGLGRVLGQVLVRCRPAELARLLHLHADVARAGAVVAHEDGAEPGRVAGARSASRCAGSSSANTASATGPPGIIRAVNAISEEVPFSGEHHGHAELVGALDVGLVAHRTTRLHDHGHARRGRRLDAVGERVEGVGRARAASGATVGLLRRDLARLHPVLLSRADADGLAVLHQHDRVRLHVPADAPRQLGVAPLGVGGSPLGDDAPVVAGGDEVVRVLHEEAAADLAEVEGLRSRAGPR